MINPLSKIYLRLTESGTQKELSLRADIIGAVVANTRGGSSVYTNLISDGDSKVFEVLEDREEVINALSSAYHAQEKLEGKKK